MQRYRRVRRVWGGIQTGGGAAGNWYTSDANVDYTTAVHYDGIGSLAMNVADGGSHPVNSNWDLAGSTGGVCSSDNVTPCTIANENTDCGGSATCLIAPEAGPWHPVVGAFEIAFYAMASNTSTGTPEVTVALSRIGGTNVSHTFTLTNDGDWHQYVYDFTGNDTAWTGGQNEQELLFTLTGTNGRRGSRSDDLCRRRVSRQAGCIEYRLQARVCYYTTGHQSRLDTTDGRRHHGRQSGPA